MTLRALDNDNDWTFGAGLANYINGVAAINQKLASRLKSFKNDNPLNMDDNIDWNDLLGRKGTQDTILREIERVALQTVGVTQITSLEVTKTADRVQSISLAYNTIYSTSETLQVDEL
jgi:hypothetical protein